MPVTHKLVKVTKVPPRKAKVVERTPELETA